MFDGDSRHSHTPLEAIHALLGENVNVRVARGMESSRCKKGDGFDDAVEIARTSEVALMFVGEDSILSGEAHCRADIDLPGNQVQLIEAVAATGTPIVLVVMAGRPLTLGNVIDHVADEQDHRAAHALAMSAATRMLFSAISKFTARLSPPVRSTNSNPRRPQMAKCSVALLR